MQTQIHIESGSQDGTGICFLVKETLKTSTLIPAEKMITDTEKNAFIYLLDEENGYGQIRFSQNVWPLLVDALKTNTDPVILYNEERITLTGFNDELNMLIFNIEGNDNYGEAFSSLVEHAFSEILKSTE